jgi:glycosyltransferase involved in cell wall biosynthesis
MRVLLLSPPTIPLPPRQYGGIERLVCGMAEELAKHGHQVMVIAAAGSQLGDVECRAWPARGTVARARYLRQVADEYQAEVIHSFTKAAYLLGLLGAKCSAPIIETYGVLPTWQARLPVALLGARLTVAGCSQWIAKSGRRIAGGRWVTIYNFVNVERYRPTATVPPDAPLVFLSRLDKIKGPDLAIEVARRTGRRLIIAGNVAPNGPNAVFWRKHVQPKLESGKFDYIGSVNDEQKNELLGKAAALLVPIRWKEPFGLVFAEALACGTPVISCPRGSLPEIVRHGVEGFLGETIDELCEAVGKIGLLDRRNCRRRVEECFSQEKIVRDYEALYQKMLASKHEA